MPNVHALVIDDNHLNTEVMSLLLEKEGVTCTVVESLRRIPPALDSLSRVDVVFLDLEFPNGDGFKILEDLKADSRLSDVPVVAYTVHTSEIDAVRRAGFDSFLGKPLDPHRFPDQLRRILQGRAVWEV